MTSGKTIVDIRGDEFYINGHPTYEGVNWKGKKIQGLLMNSRMVQATFDDLNKETHQYWDGPAGSFNAQRNTDEFIAQLPIYREHGLTGLTLNMQGGNPRGYGASQPWHNSAFEADGTLRTDYMERFKQIFDKCDQLGMAVMLGLFYFGQDQRIADESAVIAAVANIVDWICEHNYSNILIEIGNEINHPKYDHDIIKPDRCCEIAEIIKKRSAGRIDSAAGRLIVSTSFTGAHITPENVAKCMDFFLIHGNSVRDPQKIRQLAEDTRKLENYNGQPLVFNEDDHFDFDLDDNNMIAAVDSYCGWGYFDYRMEGEAFEDGFQSVPTDWQISSPRKKGFFDLLKEMTQGK